MTYEKVTWHHQFETEPVEMYMELDDNRYEKRKIEVFRSGVLSAVGTGIKSDISFLSIEPIPMPDEISKDSQFSHKMISPEDFELVWRKAIDA